jgi:hypothetical protein
MILGSGSSCKKDTDDDDCFSCKIDQSYVGGDIITFSYCKDTPEDWEDSWDSWDQLKSYAYIMQATYDYIECIF